MSVQSPWARPELESLTAGYNHMCGLDRDGRVWCWGSNKMGQLGVRGQPDGPVEVAGLSGVVMISADRDTNCALDLFGVVWCWGANYDGVLEHRPV